MWGRKALGSSALQWEGRQLTSLPQYFSPHWRYWEMFKKLNIQKVIYSLDLITETSAKEMFLIQRCCFPYILSHPIKCNSNLNMYHWSLLMRAHWIRCFIAFLPPLPSSPHEVTTVPIKVATKCRWQHLGVMQLLLWEMPSYKYNGLWNNVSAFAFIPFLPDGHTRKIWGQGIYPRSGHHSDILYRAKDASDNHIDFTCHQRGKWPGRRLGNPSQPFPLHLFTCLSALSLSLSMKSVSICWLTPWRALSCWHSKEIILLGLKSDHSGNFALYVGLIWVSEIRNDRATKEVQAW